MNPLAEQLNQTIKAANPHIYDMLSDIGKRLFFPFGKRLMNKKIFAMAALDVLRKELLGIGEP